MSSTKTMGLVRKTILSTFFPMVFFFCSYSLSKNIKISQTALFAIPRMQWKANQNTRKLVFFNPTSLPPFYYIPTSTISSQSCVIPIENHSLFVHNQKTEFLVPALFSLNCHLYLCKLLILSGPWYPYLSSEYSNLSSCLKELLRFKTDNQF